MKKQCEDCKKNFNASPSRIKIGKGRFCSKSCYRKSVENNIDCICKNCGKKYKINATQNGKKFCSWKCFLRGRKILKGKNNPLWGNRKITYCKQCRKKMSIHFSRIKNNRGKYCSKKCYSKSMVLPYEHKLKTMRRNLHKSRFGRCRKEVLDLYNHKCVLCHSSIDLVIHHIDGTGYKSIGTLKGVNNNLSNLIVYCRKCHTKIHNQANKI